MSDTNAIHLTNDDKDTLGKCIEKALDAAVVAAVKEFNPAPNLCPTCVQRAVVSALMEPIARRHVQSGGLDMLLLMMLGSALSAVREEAEGLATMAVSGRPS